MRVTIGSNNAIWPIKEYINKRRDFYSQRAKTIINYTEQGDSLHLSMEELISIVHIFVDIYFYAKSYIKPNILNSLKQ